MNTLQLFAASLFPTNDKFLKTYAYQDNQIDKKTREYFENCFIDDESIFDC